MANDKTAPQDGLRLAALTTLHWLKNRLGEAAPADWGNNPSPQDYLSTTDEDLPSIYINQGFVINIASLLDKGMWALQITEPDLGADPGNPNQKRPPVPGRIIETNVAFQIVGKELECGFKTVISDPANITPEAEVYRTTVVKLLMENPAFGLKQVTEIPMKEIRLTNNSEIKTMLWATHHADNQLPTVIFTQPVEERTVAAAPEKSRMQPCVPIGQPMFDMSGLNLPQGKKLPKAPAAAKKDERKPAAAAIPAGFVPQPQFGMKGFKMPMPQAAATAKTEIIPREIPFNLNKFTYYTFSHCRTYVLEHGANRYFTEQTGTRFNPGDIVVIYPTSFGGGERVIPFWEPEGDWDEKINAVEKGVKDYLKSQTIDYGNIMFLSGVREHLIHLSDELTENAEAAGEGFREKIKELNSDWNRVVAEKDSELEKLTAQLKRQREYASQLEEDKAKLREECSTEKKKLQDEVDRHLETIEFLKRRYDQPVNYDGIEAWVKEHFSDRLILHPKAIARMLTKSSQCADVELICDALDYLATDYWEMRYLQVPKDVTLTRCAEKYDRPFEVKPTGKVTIEAFPGEYRMKYYKDGQGNEMDSDLDYHLRVGNKSEYLLRIYFLHDDENQLIVVGSLPDHLSSVKIQ